MPKIGQTARRQRARLLLAGSLNGCIQDRMTDCKKAKSSLLSATSNRDLLWRRWLIVLESRCREHLLQGPGMKAARRANCRLDHLRGEELVAVCRPYLADRPDHL